LASFDKAVCSRKLSFSDGLENPRRTTLLGKEGHLHTIYSSFHILIESATTLKTKRLESQVVWIIGLYFVLSKVTYDQDVLSHVN
jgi:hypothetical protein